MTRDTAHTSLAEEIARAVESVPGVAFLRPGLAGRLRSTRVRPQRGTDGAPAAGVLTAGGPTTGVPMPGASMPGVSAAGVRLNRPDGTGRRHVEIHLVALKHARALDVARAARRRVEAHLVERFPAEPAPARVTVTVTGQV
ncbi:hypothetical protein J8N05_23680 [Streptomyces sp. BH-SS-21]|uniref:Asp23/Gls24 family envelope stress response protein n=1 Tax=Streptomyces liliiviolaceus TaxID=2823109 RepID=A0A941B8U8_9ACTN|nr:hypothetical protein [Streptomyces liliiviolaceus]MBQ0851172.1 hypothetical protein [Streptomyces liliiviolaceus]